jgi:Flp pilus assembly protein TadD, contains TPR repeats
MKRLALLFLCSVLNVSLAVAQDAYDYFNKGNCQMAYENYDGAIQHFSKAVELKPDYANALANRGVCYHRLKKYDLAIADYQKSETLTKGISSYNLACAYSLTGKTEEAFQWLTLCQKSDYKQSKNVLESDTDFENIRSDKRWKTILDTDWYTPYDKAIRAIDERWNASDVQGAIDQCTKANSLDPAKAKPILTRAYIYSTQQDWNKAVADYDKAIQMNAKDWEGYAAKGSFLYRQRKYSDAIGLYQQAMTLNPEYKPYSDLAMIKFALGQKQEAISDLKSYLQFYPKDDFSVYFCGFINYNLQNDAEAMTYAKQAIELNPNEPSYHLLRANILLATKDINNAVDAYTKVLSLNDKSGEAYYKRAIAKAERFAKAGNKQDKVEFCQDMEKAEELNYEGAAQYLRELCN